MKFNLLQEESEGYAKLIAEILAADNNNVPSPTLTSGVERLLTVMERLIGQFNLDPNRVVDILLDCFENSLAQRELFVRALRRFRVHRDELGKMMVMKFAFCEVSEI